MNARNTVTHMQPNWHLFRRQLGRWLAQFERSLCREHVWGHNDLITNKDRTKPNQNPRDIQMAYAIVWCPKNC
jgi:hypothetical protein